MQRKLCIPQKHSLLIMSLYHRKEKRVKIKESSLQLARGGREMRIPLLRIPSFPRIVISSEARNLPCTPVKRRLWDSDETKKFCVSSPMQEAAITLRSLGSARDNDTGGRAISHWLSSLLVEGCPCGADLSSTFGAPLLQGATLLACKNAICKRNQ